MKKDERIARDAVCAEIRALYQKLASIDRIPERVISGDAIAAASWKDSLVTAHQEGAKASCKFYKGDIPSLTARRDSLKTLLDCVL